MEAGLLQEDVIIHDDHIEGTLNYVTGYTGFSGSTELQSGNYLALKFEATEGATTTVQLLGAKTTFNPIELDSDMNAVFRITDKYTQKLKVVVTKSGESFTKVYDLSMLKLLTA